jgi:hypothetical protein
VLKCVISGFRRDVHEICALSRFHSAYISNFTPMFRDNLSVPCSSVKQSTARPLKMKPIGCPETSALNYRSTLRKMPTTRRSLKCYKFIFSFKPTSSEAKAGEASNLLKKQGCWEQWKQKYCLVSLYSVTGRVGS